MILSTRRVIRAGLVGAVSLVVLVALSLPSSGSSAFTSSERAPAPRWQPQMAYDAAMGKVVLFGGVGGRRQASAELNDTWTWDGTGWTMLTPAHVPPPREKFAMAYDAARGQIVLFGGWNEGGYLGDTWTWDGTNWTQKHPSHSPAPRDHMAMAYDAARARVVLFGGTGNAPPYLYDDTWTWDGTDWTKHSPTHAPSARTGAGMAYDIGHERVLLFAGATSNYFNDTWTWDGSDWTKLSPETSPPARYDMGIAYDTARGLLTVFGGQGFDSDLDDTWTWDGTNWTKLNPARSPLARNGMGMAYDVARSESVLFGGFLNIHFFADTWTWDGTDWAVGTAGLLRLTPRSGPPGSSVLVRGWGFAAREMVRLSFLDSNQGSVVLENVRSNFGGRFMAQVTIPAGASLGTQRVKVKGKRSGAVARRSFTVT